MIPSRIASMDALMKKKENSKKSKNTMTRNGPSNNHPSQFGSPFQHRNSTLQNSKMNLSHILPLA
jgi:hypothetical protein